MDVTRKIDIASPASVHDEVASLLEARYAPRSFKILRRLYDDVARLYAGEFPGFHACETPYHDLSHVLDVSLATARLLDGYDATHVDEKLGPEHALLAMVVAIFHDSGYIRRKADRRHKHGAEYTRTHVRRSANFLLEYLPSIGLGHLAEDAALLVHFTGYEVHPENICLRKPQHQVLGALVGSADVMAQMAGVDYLKKCYEDLYEEFRIGGMTESTDENGNVQVVYRSPEHLLEKTPGFMQAILEDRLNGCFAGHHRYASVHFGGVNLYMEAVQKNKHHLEHLLATSAVQPGFSAALPQ